MKKRGLLLVVSGSSGVGKSSVLNYITDNKILCCEHFYSISMTTRAPRKGERDGEFINFISENHFKDLISSNAFLEHIQHLGNYYGTPAEPIYEAISSGKCAILDIAVQGMRQVKAIFPECITVFISPPSFIELERRLRSRNTENEDQIKNRLAVAKYECNCSNEYDHILINDDIVTTATTLADIINEYYMKAD